MEINVFDLKKLVEKHDKTLYGNGERGVVTRISILEEFKLDMGTKLDRLNSALNWAIGLLIATLAGVIVDICVRK